MNHLALLTAAFFAFFSAGALAQTTDAYGKKMSPPQIDKSKQEGISSIEEEKKKAEKACKAKFEYSLDWTEFNSTTWDRSSFKPYHLARDCGLAFGTIRDICSKGPAAKKNVQKYFKKVVCKLHPQYHPLMKWLKDNDVEKNAKGILLNQYKDKYDEFFQSNCREGRHVSKTMHILCDLTDGVLTVKYSMWSVNNDSVIGAYLRTFFAQ